jgi:hypothetical protein
MPSPPPEAKNTGPAAEAASVIGGRLLDKGTYFLPMKQGNDFELDLSRFPIIDLQNGSKVILSAQDRVMNVDLPLIQSYWENVKVVKVPENASSQDILEAVFSAFPVKRPPTSWHLKMGACSHPRQRQMDPHRNVRRWSCPPPRLHHPHHVRRRADPWRHRPLPGPERHCHQGHPDRRNPGQSSQRFNRMRWPMSTASTVPARKPCSDHSRS